MKVSTFLICRYVDTHGGLINIVGGGIDQFISKKFPVYLNVGIFARFAAHPTELGKHKAEVLFQNADGKRLAGGTADFEVTQTVRNVNLALPQVPVLFEAPGIHSFEVLVDGKHEGSWAFTATIAKEDSAS